VVRLANKNERKGLEILKRMYQFGGKTFITSELFKTRKVVTYTKNIPIGWIDYPNKTGTYNINFTKTKRILILGHTGCLPYFEKILLPSSKQITIKEAYKQNQQIFLSYDFRRKKVVPTFGRIINSGKKEIYKITFEDGSVVYASGEHRFFTIGGKEVSVKKLKVGDKLLSIG
jgi:hypothetical protein